MESYNGEQIYWDLDGVLRNLATAVFGRQATVWDEKRDGLNILEYVDKHLNVLEKAMELEYIDLAKQFYPLQILSCQPREWRVHTDRWIWKHLPEACPYITYVKKPEEKLELLNGHILIEDYPLFSDYSKIILVDRPYNKEVVADRAINNKSLMSHIERRLEWKM